MVLFNAVVGWGSWSLHTSGLCYISFDHPLLCLQMRECTTRTSWCWTLMIKNGPFSCTVPRRTNHRATSPVSSWGGNPSYRPMFSPICERNCPSTILTWSICLRWHMWIATTQGAVWPMVPSIGVSHTPWDIRMTMGCLIFPPPHPQHSPRRRMNLTTNKDVRGLRQNLSQSLNQYIEYLLEILHSRVRVWFPAQRPILI